MIAAPKIALDITGTQSPAHRGRGIGRYVLEHALAIEGARPGHVDRYLLNESLAQPPEIDPLIPTGRLHFNSGASREWLGDGRLIYHVMSPFEFDVPLDSIWPPEVRRPDVRLVVTLYDLIPHVFPEIYLTDGAFRLRYQARLGLLAHADLLLAISDATRHDAVSRLGIDPSRVIVVGGGVSAAFQPAPDGAGENEEAIAGLRPGYLLLPGGADFRKNMPRLIRAYSQLPVELRRAHRLVIACRLTDAARQELLDTAAQRGVGSELVLTGYLPDEQLLKLYQGARLVVFPSLYEGFGLPVAEAMACGVPVVASNTSSLGELVTTPGGTFDPTDEAGIAAVLSRGLADETFRAELLAAGDERLPELQWSTVARRTLEAYDELSWLTRTATVQRRPRLAVLSPYPPQFSGISSYTHSLLPHLAESFEVDCFVDGDLDDFDPVGDANWRLRRAASFELMHSMVGYDHILYCMGNSHFHGFIVKALRAIPGVVLLHDVRLAGFYAWEGTLPGALSVGEQIDRQYGHRMPASLRSPATVLDPQTARDAGVWLLGEILDRSRAVLVHSEYSHEIARLEAEAVGVDTSISVVPFGFPHVEPIDRSSRTDGPVVVTFGIVADVKRPIAIAEAMAPIIAQRPATRLVYVGLAQEQAQVDLENAIRRLGIEHAATITGAIDGAEYWHWMREADIAIQLRAFSQGEASLTVAEAMAAGLPVVVSKLAWMGELPTGTVIGVDATATPATLTKALLRLIDDQPYRQSVAEAARSYAARHDFANAAGAIRDALLSQSHSGNRPDA